jgi:Ni/Co efflux regulator RcnB
MEANMKRLLMTVVAASALAITAAAPAFADNDHSKGKGHGKRVERDRDDDRRGDRRDDRRADVRIHFGEPQRVAVHQYYVAEQQRGFCPPGLAKKRNGCMPPGQAKKWQMGRPLPRDVIYYEVPQPLVMQIGIPPSGYKYVRVASDILMIAVGSGLVVDAIQDLGRI